MTRRAAIFVVGLVAAALVGVALLAIPGSPLEQRPTLGLDLQGGLEVTLQAVPPKDRKLTKEDLDRSVSIMRVARRQARRRRAGDPDAGLDQISIQLPGVKDPAAAAADHRQDRAARAVRPRARPRLALDRRPHATADRDAEALRPARRPAGARGQGDARHLLRLPDEGEEARPRARADEAGGAREVGRQAAARATSSSPCRRTRSSCSCGAGGAVVCPGVAQTNPTHELVVPDAVHAARGAGDDRLGPQALGHAAGLRHPHGRADRAHGLHRQGRGRSSRTITRDIAQRGKLLFNTVGGGQGDPSAFLQHFAIVLDREIKSWPTIDFEEYPGGITGLERRADLGPAEHQGGEGPCARAADRRAARRVPHTRPDRDLGDARQGLAARGEARGRRRPPRGRALPPDLLPLPRPRRRPRPRRLRGAAVRGDPPLQRDAHAPGHRRPRADTGGGRRREHRHLRTHQGRGARRALRARGDPDRATRRASRRSSTRTSSRRSPRSCCSPSRPRASAASR